MMSILFKTFVSLGSIFGILVIISVIFTFFESAKDDKDDFHLTPEEEDEIDRIKHL